MASVTVFNPNLTPIAYNLFGQIVQPLNAVVASDSDPVTQAAVMDGLLIMPSAGFGVQFPHGVVPNDVTGWSPSEEVVGIQHLPVTSAAPDDGQVLTWDQSAGMIEWESAGGASAGVASFNSRTGSVTPTSGDYTVSQVTGAAPLANPTFTGTPAAPTASGGASTTQIATTAFVGTAVAPLAPVANPTFTGTPTAPTAASTTNNTQLATTAFAQSVASAAASAAAYAAIVPMQTFAQPALDLNMSTDIVSVSGSNVFKSATANWKQNQYLVVRGAGSGAGVYIGQIASVSGASATCGSGQNAGTSNSSLQGAWCTDDAVPWQTALRNCAPGTILDGGPNFASGIVQRIDTATWANGSSVIVDSSAVAADVGKWVAAYSGIPSGTFIGSVSGASVHLVNQVGSGALTTASATAASISVGGLFIPPFVQLCPDSETAYTAPEVAVEITPISQNIRSRGRLFGIIQAGNLAPQTSDSGSLAWSPPNAHFGLTFGSGIGAITAYSLNQVGYLSGTATAFAPTIGVVVPNASGWYIGSVFLPNCYWGITTQGGPGHIAHPKMGVLSIGILMDHQYDYVTVDSLTHGVWWDYVEGVEFGHSTGLDLWAMNNTTPVVIGRADSYHFGKVNAVIMNNGFIIGDSPDSGLGVRNSYGTVDTCDIDQACAVGIEVTSSNSPGNYFGYCALGGNAQAFGPNQGGTGASACYTAAGGTGAASVIVGAWAVRSYQTQTNQSAGTTIIAPSTAFGVAGGSGGTAGVTSLAAGSGISLSASIGAVTITATGGSGGASVQPASVYNGGSVGAGPIAVPSGYSVYNYQLSASVSTTFTMPHAVSGNSMLRLTNPASNFMAPLINGYAGDTLSWPIGQPYWLTGAGVENEIGFIAVGASVMEGFPLTGWPIVTSQITYGSRSTGNGSGTTYTISVPSQPVGALLIFSQLNYPISTVTGVATSGTGTTAAWAKIDGTSDSGLNESIDLWYTTVTGAGSVTVTVTAPHGGFGYIDSFTTSLANPTWTLDVHGNVDTSSNVTSVTFPSLTPTNPNEMYVGAYTNNTNAVTLTTAYYAQADPLIWNLNASTVQAPTATQTSSQFIAAAGLIQVTAG